MTCTPMQRTYLVADVVERYVADAVAVGMRRYRADGHADTEGDVGVAHHHVLGAVGVAGASVSDGLHSDSVVEILCFARVEGCQPDTTR